MIIFECVLQQKICPILFLHKKTRFPEGIKLTVCVLSRFSCLQLFVTPMDSSPPGPSVHGILQARILDWVAMPSSRGSSPPRVKPVSRVSCFGTWVLYHQHYLGSPIKLPRDPKLGPHSTVLGTPLVIQLFPGPSQVVEYSIIFVSCCFHWEQWSLTFWWGRA